MVSTWCTLICYPVQILSWHSFQKKIFVCQVWLTCCILHCFQKSNPLWTNKISFQHENSHFPHTFNLIFFFLFFVFYFFFANKWKQQQKIFLTRLCQLFLLRLQLRPLLYRHGRSSNLSVAPAGSLFFAWCNWSVCQICKCWLMEGYWDRDSSLRRILYYVTHSCIWYS